LKPGLYGLKIGYFRILLLSQPPKTKENNKHNSLQSIRPSIMFNKVFLAAALIGSTLANPLPSDDNTPVVRRASVPANDTCMVEDRVGSKRVEVYATKDSMPIDQVCGQGYLDNFRGGCGTITH
jgi:hypothetical protein